MSGGAAPHSGTGTLDGEIMVAGVAAWWAEPLSGLGLMCWTWANDHRPSYSLCCILFNK